MLMMAVNDDNSVRVNPAFEARNGRYAAEPLVRCFARSAGSSLALEKTGRTAGFSGKLSSLVLITCYSFHYFSCHVWL